MLLGLGEGHGAPEKTAPSWPSPCTALPLRHTLMFENKGTAILSVELRILCDLFPSQRLTRLDVDLPQG